jgi:hypothetical protein
MDADQLYGLPLDRFVPERKALARALRAQGRRAEAADVAARRRPSVAAWAVDQLVRTQPRALGELFDAGDALREAQAQLLASTGGRDALRAAAERERTAVDALVRAARGLLTAQGHDLSAATIGRVGETLHAAALDDDARAQVRDGRLERELRHVGFGAGASVPEPAAKARAELERGERERARERAADEQRRERERAAEAQAEVERRERKRAQAREVARAAEADARREAERAAAALDLAQERHRNAALALRDADEAVAAARRERDSTAAAHGRAQQEVERTEAEH